MVEAITSETKTVSLDLNELRRMLMTSNKEESKLSSKSSEESPKKLSDREIEKEILLSSNSDVENEKEAISNEESVPAPISVDAGSSGIASSNSVGFANVESDDESYNEDMDYNSDGVVSDEERIRYYSEKYATLDSAEDIEMEAKSALQSIDNSGVLFDAKTSATSPIQDNSHQSLISKMMATYGTTSQASQSNLQVLV